MNERKDGWMVNGWMGEHMKVLLMNEWMDVWMNERIDGRMNK